MIRPCAVRASCSPSSRSWSSSRRRAASFGAQHRHPRLSSAIPLLTSLHSTTALSGGFRYSPTTSVSRGLPMKPGGRPAHLCPECAETPTSPASFHCSCRCHSTALPEQPRRRGQLAGQPDAARVGGQAGLDARGACAPAANRSLDGLRGEADDADARASREIQPVTSRMRVWSSSSRRAKIGL